MKINTYFGFVIKVLLPFSILLLLSIIGMTVCFIVVPNEMNGCIWLLACFVTFFISISIAMLVLALCSTKKWFLFDNDSIKICNKKGIYEVINTADIELIHYRSFKFRYIITIFFGELNECGAWKLFIKFKDNTTQLLCFFDLKSAKKIKELYGDIVTIY